MSPLLLHITTTDMSLSLLLGPQLQAFARAGYDVVGASAPGAYVAALETSGIPHFPLRHATRAMAPHRDALALAELCGLFRRLRPDVVHTHNPKPGIYGRLAARASGVPVVVNTVHGLYALPTDGLAKRAAVYGLERLAAMCSQAELVQNPEDVATLIRIGVPAAKIHLLGNGIDLARFDPERMAPDRVAAVRREMGVEADEVVCLVVGRLVAEKGYRDVFAAAPIARSSAPALRFVVVGASDRDKSDAITADEIARAGSSAGIRFLGARADVEYLYAASDFYLLASHREGFPRSAMEAAAMGLPVVATDIRGCRQVVDPGRTGLLVRPCDPRAIALAVSELAADGGRRKRMGAAARSKARREFDQERVIGITLDTYDRLLGRKRDAAAA